MRAVLIRRRGERGLSVADAIRGPRYASCQTELAGRFVVGKFRVERKKLGAGCYVLSVQEREGRDAEELESRAVWLEVVRGRGLASVGSHGARVQCRRMGMIWCKGLHEDVHAK